MRQKCCYKLWVFQVEKKKKNMKKERAEQTRTSGDKWYHFGVAVSGILSDMF